MEIAFWLSFRTFIKILFLAFEIPIGLDRGRGLRRSLAYLGPKYEGTRKYYIGSLFICVRCGQEGIWQLIGLGRGELAGSLL